MPSLLTQVAAHGTRVCHELNLNLGQHGLNQSDWIFAGSVAM